MALIMVVSKTADNTSTGTMSVRCQCEKNENSINLIMKKIIILECIAVA